MSLKDSAASGDHLATLKDLRDLLAANILDCESLRDLATLSGRLQSVLDQIAELEPAAEVGDGIDEIAQRRATRRTVAAKGSVRAR